MTIEGTDQPRNNIWIANSAASMHITNKETSLYNIRNIREPVKIRDGNLVYATKVGKLCMTYAKNSEEQEDFVLENIQYILDFWVSLFSVTAMMSKGCQILNEDKAIVIEKNGLCLIFDEEIKTKKWICMWNHAGGEDKG